MQGSCIETYQIELGTRKEDELGKGFDTFMENPYWKGIYDNAPSDWCREYYQLMFDMSPWVMGGDYKDEAAESRLKEVWLDRADIEYLLECAGTAQAKMMYAKGLKFLDNHEEFDSVAGSSFMAEVRNPHYRPPEAKE